MIKTKSHVGLRHLNVGQNKRVTLRITDLQWFISTLKWSQHISSEAKEIISGETGANYPEVRYVSRLHCNTTLHAMVPQDCMVCTSPLPLIISHRAFLFHWENRTCQEQLLLKNTQMNKSWHGSPLIRFFECLYRFQNQARPQHAQYK